MPDAPRPDLPRHLFGIKFFSNSCQRCSDTFELLPDGDYVLNVIKSAVKPTRKGGKRISVELAVDEAPNAGRRIFASFNVINDNPTAQDIGRREWAQLLHAVGMVGERDVAKVVGAR